MPQLLADALDVGDEVPGGVVLDAGVRARPAAAALVEQDHPVVRRVEEPPHPRRAAAARPAVQHHHRRAVGPAALLDIDPVAAGHLHHLLAERLDRRIESAAGAGAGVARVFLHGRTIYPDDVQRTIAGWRNECNAERRYG